MAYAFRMMSYRVVHIRLTGRQYETLRQETQETFIQNGRFHKGRKRSPETCQRLSQASKGRRKGIPFTEEQKKKLREAAKHRKPRSPEAIKNGRKN